MGTPIATEGEIAGNGGPLQAKQRRCKPLIYVAGTLTSGGSLPATEIEKNVARAARVYGDLVSLGFACILPHTSWYLESLHGMKLGYSGWMAQCLRLVEACEAVYRISGPSKGADMECEHAADHGIQVWFHAPAMIAHFHDQGRLP